MKTPTTEEEFYEKYPLILRDMGEDPSQTCMAWGLDVGKGWYPLLDNLMYALQFAHDKNGYPQTVATQVKEKFGTLSFYTSYLPNATNHPHKKNDAAYLDGLIAFASIMSGNICEDCGSPGERTSGSWIKTVCKDCGVKNG